MRIPKSRSKRRIAVKVPGGSTKVHLKDRKPKIAKCSECGAKLKGVVRGSSTQMKNMAKTIKRPERPYGGVLCSKCMRTLIKSRARK